MTALHPSEPFRIHGEIDRSQTKAEARLTAAWDEQETSFFAQDVLTGLSPRAKRFSR
jgi:hypothetical protein